MAKKLLVTAACLLCAAHAPALGRERVHVAPDPEKPAAAAPSERAERALPKPSNLDALSTTGSAGHRLVGQVNPAPRTTLGIGIWRVEKSDRYDPNRGQPMRDRTGKLSGIAAIGLNIGF